MGDRGANSGMASSGASRSSSGGATLQTKGYHDAQVQKLSGSDYSDGTYDLNTLTQVSYDSGYQVTFSQIGDNYSAEEYASRVNEFLRVSSDGKVLAGKFESTPEVSFHCSSRATAIRLAKKYNQISIWDWGKCDEIKTGGTGRRR